MGCGVTPWEGHPKTPDKPAHHRAPCWAQGSNGDVPVVVPGKDPGGNSCNDIAWTSAYPQIADSAPHPSSSADTPLRSLRRLTAALCPAVLHTYYGDTRLAERHWPALVQCVT